MSRFGDMVRNVFSTSEAATQRGLDADDISRLPEWGYADGFSVNDARPILTRAQLMDIPVIAAGVSLISETASMLPIRMYRTVGTTTTEVKRGPGNVINRFWSDRWTRTAAVRYLVRQILVTGSGFALIERNDRNEVMNLYPVPSTSIMIRNHRGVTTYRYNVGGERFDIPREDILDFVLKYDDDGWNRIAKVDECREVAARYALQARNARRFFTSGATTFALTFPPWASGDSTSDKKQAKERENIVAMTREANRKGSPFLMLEHGMELKQIGTDPEKSQFVNQQLWCVQEILRVLDIPPPIAGELSKGTYNNTEQSATFLVKHTLQPIMAMIEQEMDLKFFGRRNGGRMHVRFDTTEFTKGDMKIRADVAARLVVSGVLSQNEARELIAVTGVARTDDPSHDELHQQQQMLPPEQPDDTGNGNGNVGEGNGTDGNEPR